jgi:hypothetical protein
VRGSRFTEVRGPAIRTGEGARPTVRQNIFVRGTAGARQALDIGAGTAPRFVDNVFSGYSEREILQAAPASAAAALSRARALLQGNYVVSGQSRGR